MMAYAEKFHPAVLAGALWATFAAFMVRRRLKSSGIGASAPRPPGSAGKPDEGWRERCTGSSRLAWRGPS